MRHSIAPAPQHRTRVRAGKKHAQANDGADGVAAPELSDCARIGASLCAEDARVRITNVQVAPL